MTHDAMIEVIQAHRDGEEIEVSCIYDGEDWIDSEDPSWNFTNYVYKVKKEPEYIYPMWFKNTIGNLVVKFESLESGTVVEANSNYWKDGEKYETWAPHTDTKVWTQVEEPKELLWFWSVYDDFDEHWSLNPVMYTEEDISSKYSIYTRLDALGSKEQSATSKVLCS